MIHRDSYGDFDVYVRTSWDGREFLGTHEDTFVDDLLEELEERGYDTGDDDEPGPHYGDIYVERAA